MKNECNYAVSVILVRNETEHTHVARLQKTKQKTIPKRATRVVVNHFNHQKMIVADRSELID